MNTDEITLETLAARLDELLAKIDAPQQRYLTVEQAATYTSLSAESVRRMLSAGRLTALRPVRGRIVIDRQELDDAIQQSRGRPRKGRGIRQ